MSRQLLHNIVVPESIMPLTSSRANGVSTLADFYASEEWMSIALNEIEASTGDVLSKSSQVSLALSYVLGTHNFHISFLNSYPINVKSISLDC